MHRTAEWTVDVMKAARTEIFEPKVHTLYNIIVMIIIDILCIYKLGLT